MTSVRERVPLLDVRPELARYLSADDRAELRAVTLPVIVAGPGRLDLDGILAAHKAFGATVCNGMVMSSLRVGEQTGIHVLGPGDTLPSSGEIGPDWLEPSEFTTATEVQLGLFGNDLLVTAHHWPRIVEGLQASTSEQLRRLAAQMVICQLPRVEDRVVAMLWLLAESWGHVTPGGIRLPLTLTHETLGALVGARRPTVTLALRKLSEQGALVVQDSGWLLIEPPAHATDAAARLTPAQQSEPLTHGWARVTPPVPLDPTVAYAELRDTVRRLRERHSVDVEHARERVSKIRRDRVRAVALREQIAEAALKRRRPPSS